MTYKREFGELSQGTAILTVLSLCIIVTACGDDKQPISSGTPNTGATLVAHGTSPATSPDGASIAYEAGGGIVALDLISGVADTVITFGRNPDWSPHRDTIVVQVSGGLYTVSLSTGDTMLFVAGSNLEAPDWSPLGDEILTMGRGPDGAYLTSYPAGVTTMIPCSMDGVMPCQGEGPSFSGDGQWITHEEGLKIMKVSRSGGQAQTVVEGLRDVTEPAWSPDGKYIAFVMQGTSYATTHIWVADQRGHTFGLWQVTDGAYTDREPAWASDSRTIYFTRNDTLFSGMTGIYEVQFGGN